MAPSDLRRDELTMRGSSDAACPYRPAVARVLLTLGLRIMRRLRATARDDAHGWGRPDPRRYQCPSVASLRAIICNLADERPLDVEQWFLELRKKLLSCFGLSVPRLLTPVKST